MQESQDKMKDFDKLNTELIEQGFIREDATISILKANAGAILYSAPLIIVGVFIFFIVHPQSEGVIAFGLGDILIVLLLLVVSIPVHELLHGLGWGLFSEGKFKDIRFGVLRESLTPYCHCKKPLSFGPYIFGGLLPFLVLGLGVYLVALFTGNIFILFLSAINILTAGGDLMIVAKLMKYRSSLLVDHPTDCGFVAYRKPEDSSSPE